jgi:integrase
MNLVLKFAFQNKRLDHKPILHNPKKLSEVSKEFTDEEINSIMRESPEPLRLINYIALKIGARDDEILKLKWSDINYKLKQISLNGKTGPRISVAPEALLELLKARQKTSVSKWVFPQITNPEKPLDNGTRHNYWDQARKRAGVEGRFHDWKHTAITRMLRAGMTVEWVSKQVGTSPEVIREVYDKLKIQEVPEIADAVTIEGESLFFQGGLGVDNEA